MAMCGILRVAQYQAGAIGAIGKEEDRSVETQTNPDIDPERTKLNETVMRDDNKTLTRAWQDKCRELGVSLTRKDQIAMEQAVITASPEFWRRQGWDIDAVRDRQEVPQGIIDYFNSALTWAYKYFGKDNVISATIHCDETSPHMHIDYVPVVEASRKRKDVYQRDADGKLVRDDYGHCIRARDETGRVIYDYVDAPARLSRSEYWQQRGGRQSYRMMQDDFYKSVSQQYGLERGEIGTGRQHIEQQRHKAVVAHKELEQAQASVSAERQAYIKIQTKAREADRSRRDAEEKSALAIQSAQKAQNEAQEATQRRLEAQEAEQAIKSRLDASKSQLEAIDAQIEDITQPSKLDAAARERKTLRGKRYYEVDATTWEVMRGAVRRNKQIVEQVEADNARLQRDRDNYIHNANQRLRQYADKAKAFDDIQRGISKQEPDLQKIANQVISNMLYWGQHKDITHNLDRGDELTL